MILANKIFKDYQNDHNAQNRVFGFWLYILTDCILFGTFFAVYIVLMNNITLGNSPKELFELSNVFIETIVLLTSSLTCGIAMINLKYQNIQKAMLFFALTGILGIIFLAVEIHEFYTLIQQGATPQSSGFLSGFFALTGLHGLHITIGLVWLVVLLIQLKFKGNSVTLFTRFSCFSIFWHFLDIVWICLFTVVYLFGVIL